MAKRMIQIIIAVALGWAATQAAMAEGLPDPTRPPLEAGFSAGANVTPNVGPVLQSVKIAPGRRSAVISGQLLVEGDRLGEAKLVSISESGVVLQGPEGRQTLKLFPSVEKNVIHPFSGRYPKHDKQKSKRKTEQKAP